MESIDIIKKRLIRQIQSSDNENFLRELERLLHRKKTEDIIHLSSEQIEILLLGEKDIMEGKVVSESDMEETDKRWLR